HEEGVGARRRDDGVVADRADADHRPGDEPCPKIPLLLPQLVDTPAQLLRRLERGPSQEHADRAAADDGRRAQVRPPSASARAAADRSETTSTAPAPRRAAPRVGSTATPSTSTPAGQAAVTPDGASSIARAHSAETPASSSARSKRAGSGFPGPSSPETTAVNASARPAACRNASASARGAEVTRTRRMPLDAASRINSFAPPAGATIA